jgi:hypothetical protein
MATIEDAISTFVLTQTAITAYIGNDVYFGALPSGYEELTTDYIVYFMVSPDNTPASFGDTTTARPRFQFGIFSKNATSAIAIGNLLVTALHGFRGTLASGIVVLTSFASGPEVNRDTSDEQWYHGIVEWEVEYTR